MGYIKIKPPLSFVLYNFFDCIRIFFFMNRYKVNQIFFVVKNYKIFPQTTLLVKKFIRCFQIFRNFIFLYPVLLSFLGCPMYDFFFKRGYESLPRLNSVFDRCIANLSRDSPCDLLIGDDSFFWSCLRRRIKRMLGSGGAKSVLGMKACFPLDDSVRTICYII